ncbi:DUF2213 domain-containing protein [Citrobacter freundii]|uniref:DUF2213 domain-containing protein n=1 Tax=Citrobacter TaxID=544 RepID=UPI001D3B6451|nr:MULTISPECIES: DUF2213 domain-containing protein [unclassified Citrobacter]MBJ8796714.1 DUF2213 domain-containing protein [Citrobacter freundii]MDM2887757.1 DUF2213 domain-containing protein [Citrobacter sp. Cpo045]MDM2915076.1 DUF2213 domain-containing protein [Citrobacter sp. Cpo035]
MMTTGAKAQDRSARVVDDNGWINVEGNPISKVGVFDYLGSEIPGAPDPNKIYQVYRPAEELSRPETLESFKLIPFINNHTWLGVEGANPGDVGVDGIVGEKVYFDYPYLKANLRVFSDEMKQELESGRTQLSPAYKYDVEHAPGVFEGQPYQYVQRNLRCGNHLARVDEGRTGPDVAVMDQAINQNSDGDKTMTLEELIAALGKLDAPSIAAVMAALQQMNQPEATTDVVTDEDTTDTTMATDEDTSEETTAQDDDTTTEQAQDEDTTEETKAQDAKIAALTKQVRTLTNQVKAQDTGALLKELGKRNELASRLTQHIGAFACDSMDTIAVAKYGLEKLGIKGIAAGHEVSALNAALAMKAATPRTIVAFGQDAAPTKDNAVSSAIDAL